MGLFGPPDIGKLKAKGDLAALLRATEHKDPAIAAAALDALLSFGPAAAPAVVPGLSAPEEAQRAHAADILTRLGWTSANASEEVALLIAQQKWAELPEVGEAAVAPLSTILKNPGRGQGLDIVAVMALWAIGSRPALDALLNALRQGRREAAFAMVALSQMQASMGEVAAMLESPTVAGRTKIGASQILGLLGAEAVPTVLQTIESCSGESRAYALIALMCTADPRTVEVGKRYLPSLDAETAAEMQNMLGYFEGGTSALVGALASPNSGDRGIACIALGNLRQVEAVEPLKARLADANPLIVLASSNALAKIGTPEAVQALVEFVAKRNEAFQVMAIASLALVSEKGLADQALAARTDDPSLAVRACAAIVAQRRASA